MDSEKQYKAFLNLSAEVTGYTSTDLLGTGVAWDYFDTFTKIVGEDICFDLWKVSETIIHKHADADKKEEAIRLKLLSSDKFGPLVRNLIKLWYLGQWDELPNYWRETYGTSLLDKDTILSGNSYKEGLVWSAIGAHPMGAKQPGFGTWSDPPELPDLE